MCARPPLLVVSATSAPTDAEPQRAETPCGQDAGEPPFAPLSRAQTLHSDSPAFRHLRAGLRSVKSGPVAMPFPRAPCSPSDETGGSSPAEVPSLRDYSCDSPGCSPRCGAGPRGVDPALAEERASAGCSKGNACCKGACSSGGEQGSSSGEGSKEGGQQRARPVARVTVRKGLSKKRPFNSNASTSSDYACSSDLPGLVSPAKPTFGDLEDLWRKDSEARNYCAFVCSAPAMCRGGQEVLEDAMPGITIDSSRRKRFKASTAMEDSAKSIASVLALLA